MIWRRDSVDLAKRPRVPAICGPGRRTDVTYLLSCFLLPLRRNIFRSDGVSLVAPGVTNIVEHVAHFLVGEVDADHLVCRLLLSILGGSFEAGFVRDVLFVGCVMTTCVRVYSQVPVFCFIW